MLIHGFGVDLHMWDPQMAALNATFRVLRYDLPSHGKSPTPRESQPGWRDLTFLLGFAALMFVLETALFRRSL